MRRRPLSLTLAQLSLVVCASGSGPASNSSGLGPASNSSGLGSARNSSGLAARNSSGLAASNESEACAFARHFLAGSAERDISSVCSCVDGAAAGEAAATRAAAVVLPAAPAQGWLWWGGADGDDDAAAASSAACDDMCACAREALDLSARLCEDMCALVGAFRSRAVSHASREMMFGWVGVPLLVVGTAALRLHSGKRARARSWYEPIPR